MMIISQIWLAVTGVVLGLALLRLWRGPTLGDRIVAIDLMSTVGMGACILLAINSGAAVYLDIALVLGMVMFLSTVALAKYLDTRRDRDPGPKEPS